MENKKEELREKLNTLLKALEEIENMPDKDYEKEILYNKIAFTYIKLKEYEKGTEYLKKVSEIIRKYQNMQLEITKMIINAQTLKKLKKYNEAEKTLHEALEKISQIKQSNSSGINREIADTLELTVNHLLSLIHKEEEQLKKILE
jgi:tetratricopeptide (TPR) repeat protein